MNEIIISIALICQMRPTGSQMISTDSVQKMQQSCMKSILKCIRKLKKRDEKNRISQDNSQYIVSFPANEEYLEKCL